MLRDTVRPSWLPSARCGAARRLPTCWSSTIPPSSSTACRPSQVLVRHHRGRRRHRPASAGAGSCGGPRQRPRRREAMTEAAFAAAWPPLSFRRARRRRALRGVDPGYRLHRRAPPVARLLSGCCRMGPRCSSTGSACPCGRSPSTARRGSSAPPSRSRRSPARSSRSPGATRRGARRRSPMPGAAQGVVFAGDLLTRCSRVLGGDGHRPRAWSCSPQGDAAPALAPCADACLWRRLLFAGILTSIGSGGLAISPFAADSPATWLMLCRHPGQCRRAAGFSAWVAGCLSARLLVRRGVPLSGLHHQGREGHA